MDSKLVNELLHEDESSALDFKRDQYPFDGADDIAKSELLKDILAFANSWRRTNAYILIGIEDVQGGRSKPVGIAAHHDDAKLQQFVNSKTNRPIAFAYEATTIDGVQVGVIRIEVQERPFFLKKDFGKLKAGVVYLRRGSSTDTADPAEVHRMGAAAAREDTPKLEENLKVSLKGHGAGTSRPPFSTGEPMHLVLDLTLTNLGTSPVFIVSADLRDAPGRHIFPFTDVCNETEPIQPNGHRKGRLNLLYHSPFPRTPRQPRTPEALQEENLWQFRLLRFICQEESVFRVETGRGSILTFPAKEVCDESFLGWPAFAPQEIIDELGKKSLEDFEEESRAGWERAAGRNNQPSILVDVRAFYYQDVTNTPNDPIKVATPHPRRYLTELGLTNQSDRPIFIREITATVGSQTYGRSEGAEVIRIEPGEYQEIDESFPVNGIAAPQSGEFELQIWPAVGEPVRTTGTFPVTS